MSLKSITLNYIRNQYPNAVHKGVIGRKAVLEWGYENENVGRRCRELENEGQITAEYNEKREVLYRWNPNYSPPEEKEKMYVRKIPKRFYDPQIVEKINALNPRKEIQKIEQTLFK